VKPSYEQVVQCVSYGTTDGVMPSFLDRNLTPSDIEDLAAYVSETTHGTTSIPGSVGSASRTTENADAPPG